MNHVPVCVDKCAYCKTFYLCNFVTLFLISYIYKNNQYLDAEDLKYLFLFDGY